MPQFRNIVLVAAMVSAVTAVPRAGTGAQTSTLALFDRILDTYVRDGYVYYQALKTERQSLDRYVASLDLSPDELARMADVDARAFWINAYNALVLRTVINAYPIHGTADTYPASSVAQIPGGFTRIGHRVAGRTLTLDAIETTVISGFGDARMLLALGRGTIGSGRLRSEAYRGETLEQQLTAVVKEFVTRADGFGINQQAGTVRFSPLFSWREADFVTSFSAGGDMWANRSPLERAVVNMAYPHLFSGERQFLALNTFQAAFGEYDWRLNDLTNR